MSLTSNGSTHVQIRSQRSLATAIVQTVAYVDVFDFPLLPAEVHRYLIGMAVPPAAVRTLLADGQLVPGPLARREGYVTLAGRQQIVETRRRREVVARHLWPVATHYGGIIAGLPFVQMVAVTGSLAVNNAEEDGDIDYLIITANDRLWLSRAFIILIVRLAARRGIQLCPNYLLSERSLTFPEQNLYTAHELAQMVPLSGRQVYARIRRLNRWTEKWLPNATSPPRPALALDGQAKPASSRLRGVLEQGLRGRVGGRLEQWEMRRKLAKFERQAAQTAPEGDGLEVYFGADWCKGHFDGHAGRIMDAFAERIDTLGIEG